jgi:uncharacterized protein YneF (UPF0154 family)
MSSRHVNQQINIQHIDPNPNSHSQCIMRKGIQLLELDFAISVLWFCSFYALILILIYLLCFLWRIKSIVLEKWIITSQLFQAKLFVSVSYWICIILITIAFAWFLPIGWYIPVKSMVGLTLYAPPIQFSPLQNFYILNAQKWADVGDENYEGRHKTFKIQ